MSRATAPCDRARPTARSSVRGRSASSGDAPRRGAAAPWRRTGPPARSAGGAGGAGARSASGVKSGTVQRTLRRKYTTAPTSKKATRSAHSRRSTTSSPADSAATAGARRAAALVDRLRPHHEVGELAVGARTDLLRQVGPARPQHPGDLLPEDDDGMAAHHEVERGVGEGQRGRVRRGDDPGAERLQPACGPPRRWATTPRSPPGARAAAPPWRAPPRRPSRCRARPRRGPCAPPCRRA